MWLVPGTIGDGGSAANVVRAVADMQSKGTLAKDRKVEWVHSVDPTLRDGCAPRTACSTTALQLAMLHQCSLAAWPLVCLPLHRLIFPVVDVAPRLIVRLPNTLLRCVL
jgi:hypothetical protein